MMNKLATRIANELGRGKLRAPVAIEVIPPVEEGDTEFIHIQVQGEPVGYFIDPNPLKPGFDLFHGKELLISQGLGSFIAGWLGQTLSIPGSRDSGFEGVTVPDFLPESFD